MYAVVMFLKTVWDNHGVFYFRSRFLCFKQPIKKIRIHSKILCPQSPSFLVPRPQPAEEKRKVLWGREWKAFSLSAGFGSFLSQFATVKKRHMHSSPTSICDILKPTKALFISNRYDGFLCVIQIIQISK